MRMMLRATAGIRTRSQPILSRPRLPDCATVAWRWRDSNPRPSRCERDALPTAPHPRRKSRTAYADDTAKCSHRDSNPGSSVCKTAALPLGYGSERTTGFEPAYPVWQTGALTIGRHPREDDPAGATADLYGTDGRRSRSLSERAAGIEPAPSAWEAEILTFGTMLACVPIQGLEP